MAVSSKAHLILWAVITSVPLNAQPTSAIVDTVSPNGPVVAAEGVARVITLHEMGFEQGVEFIGLSGSSELYFPLPTASRIASLRLRLPYRSDSAFESRRSLAIEADGRTLYTTALPPGPSSGVIDLPVDPTMIRAGFLTVRLLYNGAITEDRCLDQRLSGSFLDFTANGGLTVSLTPQVVAELGQVAAIMPAAADIVLPDELSEGQAVAALTLALGNPQARIITTSVDDPGSAGMWERSRIVLDGSAAPALAMATVGGVPEIRIGGSDPAAAAKLLRSRWRALVRASSRRDGDGPDRLTFADLQGDTSVREISDRGTWTTSLPIVALPASRAMEALVVDTAVADDGNATPPVVSVLMNGLLLGSAEAKRGDRTRLNLAIPTGLPRARNSIEVSVTRQVSSDDCSLVPRGYPAQVLPSSYITLGPAGEVHDFSDLAAVFNSGFSVQLASPQHLSATAVLLQALAGADAPIAVSFGAPPDSGPYVYVGPNAPPGTEPRIVFANERVEIAVENDRSLFSSEALETLTVVQLLEAANGPILWIRPGRDFGAIAATDQPIDLSYGDVALIVDGRIELAFSSDRDRLIDIRYPDRTGVGDLLVRYRLWLIGFSWLIASIGFVYLLRRVYAARKSPD